MSGQVTNCPFGYLIAYSGSANLTGAGMGAKSDRRRNFEAGFLVMESALVRAIMEQFDRIWMGQACEACGRKAHCPDPRAAE